MHRAELEEMSFSYYARFTFEAHCHASGGDLARNMCHVSQWIIVSIKDISHSRVIIRLFFFSAEPCVENFQNFLRKT